MPAARPTPGAASAADEALARGVAALGAPDTAMPVLLAYLDELVRWSRAYNLTGIRDPLRMVSHHLLDSLAVLPYCAPPLIDVGSGAGLPGLVLAIARRDWPVTVLDAAGKKARFLRHVARHLALDNVEVIETRVEVYSPSRPAATVISRAFAELGEFLRLTLHLSGTSGRWLAMKGKLRRHELEAVPPAMSVQAVHPLQIPGLAAERHLVVAVRASGSQRA
ncbi:MAG: 16S rRNA (guanine(527)-N(7))-methyltransferase RsmG [Gammaproteobacteria bacterium]|nr:16S rRNA (guanine(527)-N(7))-methyltransferase RsmG [Gammaproteobacteria bacterium]